MPAEPHRVAVIGGGVAGLTAARELMLHGCRVELFEADDRLGGKVRQAKLDGHDFDIGAEAFATRGEAVAGLLAELGLSEQIVFPEPLGSWSVRGQRAVKFPAAGAVGIPVSPLARASFRALGLGGAVRAAIEPMLLRSVGDDATTVAELVRARAGRRVLERLVRPIALGVYSTEPERLPVSAVPGLAEAFATRRSLLRASATLRDRSLAAGSAVGALAGGMAPLIDALEAELRDGGALVNLGSPVTALEARGAAWRVRAAGGARDVDSVVIATPEAAARAMTSLPAAEDPSVVGDHPVEVIALLVENAMLDRAPRGTGALVTSETTHVSGSGSEAPIRAKALTHVTAKWPDRAVSLQRGQHVIRLSYGRRHEPPPTLGLDDVQVLALAAHDATRILGTPVLRRSILDWSRRTWQMPAPRPVHPPESPAGIAFVGDWIAGTGLAATISHARATARRLTLEPTR